MQCTLKKVFDGNIKLLRGKSWFHSQAMFSTFKCNVWGKNTGQILCQPIKCLLFSLEMEAKQPFSYWVQGCGEAVAYHMCHGVRFMLNPERFNSLTPTYFPEKLIILIKLTEAIVAIVYSHFSKYNSLFLHQMEGFAVSNCGL